MIEPETEMEDKQFSMVDNPDEVPHPKRHQLEPFRDSSKTRVLRFWLNIIFMVGAITGLVVYFYADKEVAKYILAVSCVFKFIELALRILKI